MSTASDRLVAIDAAIDAALNGQSVRWGDRSYTSHNIKDLMDIRADWARRVDMENRQAKGDYSSARYQTSDFS